VASWTEDLSEEIVVASGNSSSPLPLITMELIGTYSGTPWPSSSIPGQLTTSSWRSGDETTLAATDPNQNGDVPTVQPRREGEADFDSLFNL
jgi:hypothetical protein